MDTPESTEILLKKLNSGLDINPVSIPDPMKYIAELLNHYGFTPSSLATIMGYSRTRLCSYFNFTTEDTPSRIQIIMMMVIIGATIEETQNALKYSLEKELYIKVPKELLIYKFICDYSKNKSSEFIPSKKERYDEGVQRYQLLNTKLTEAGFQPLAPEEK